MFQQPREELAPDELVTNRIEIKILDRDHDLCYQLNGSCISSPQRYQLLSILILIITLVVPQPFTLVIGLVLAGWSSRRFKLEVSSMKGVELSLYMIFPYRKVRLPLLGTQIKIFELQPHHSSVFSLNTMEQKVISDTSENRLVEIGLTHPKLDTDPLTLLSLNPESARKLSHLFASWVRKVQQERSLSARTPLQLFNHEPGEWMIAMIDLFPYVLGPKRKGSQICTQLSWWSPSNALIIISLSILILGCVVILLHPLIGSFLILFSLVLLSSDREEFILDRQEVVWRKLRLGLPIHELTFGPQLNLKLEEDLHAPSGRRLLITDVRNPLITLVTGHPWDAAWIFKELTGCIEHHRQTVLQ